MVVMRDRKEEAAEEGERGSGREWTRAEENILETDWRQITQQVGTLCAALRQPRLILRGMGCCWELWKKGLTGKVVGHQFGSICGPNTTRE